MDFIIATDSTCDLPKEMLSAMGVESRDMLYYVDGEEYGKDVLYLAFASALSGTYEN